MDPTTLDRFRALIYREAGIALGPKKDALVQARVSKRLRVLRLDTFEDYLEHVEADRSGDEIVQLLDVVCTNVTSFFREPAHFEFIASAVEEWLAEGQQRFRFWSAACSTGEEVWSLAMTIRETTGATRPDVKILATDLSTFALQRCAQGVYEERKMEGVPPDLRKRYFTRHRDHGSATYRVRDDLREMVVLRRMNLSTPPFPMPGPLDVVMCRNVMIYFDDAVRKPLLDEVRRLLKTGGYLMVGHAESLTGMVGHLGNVAPGVYAKRRP